MSKLVSLTAISLFVAAPLFAQTAFNLGRTALPEEIAAWDVDVLPDGRGLPEGSGDVLVGEEIFSERCGFCHGDFGEGVDNWPVLAGGFDTLADEDPVKTIGSYWPHLSTVWDYVNRSMPFGSAQTLTEDEVYAITAYILYSNDLVDDDFVLSNENFTEITMPNAGGFILDDRPETEYAIWTGEPCMENCKESVEVTMRASVLNVTPDEGMTDDMTDHGEGAEVSDAAEAVEPEAEEMAAAEVVAETAPAVDPKLVAAGENVFKKCRACHKVGEGAKNGTGPQLNGVFDHALGSVDDFRYSKGFEEAMAEGRVWDDASMGEFLTNPKAYMPGTKMSFAGLKKQEDIDAVIAYLRSFSE